MIERKQYLDKLISFKDKKLIKVVTGIRRCGKSTLFLLYQQYLRQKGIDASQIQNINLEDLDNLHLRNFEVLYKHIMQNAVKNKKNYIFLDEIQLVPEFEKTVDSLFIKENMDVYITGSNAHMLSGELATLLSGRYVEIKMLPLSFKEYCSAFSENQNIERLFNDYLLNSSFPYTLELTNKDNINDYLSGLYNTVLLKDIIARRKFSDVQQVENIIKFLADNIGNECSLRKISNCLTTEGRKTSYHLVDNIIDALKESFVIYSASKYDIKGKQYLQSGEKYYLVDIGLRYMLLGNKPTDYGHILENVVYLELLRRGYKVFVGKNNNSEVDFVATNRDTVEYYQVSHSVADSHTLERELKSLQSIKDNYPKYLLTRDIMPNVDHNGIKQINVLDWLLKE
ncbi:MAG: ATPase [Acetobacter sp. 46_36]|nr:MAG: ATPase [Acetobacter sp. 46_36]